MTLTLEVEGQKFDNFESASVGYSMREGSGIFSFKMASDAPTSFPIKAGNSVKVLADGATVLTGFVDDVSVRFDSTSHEIIADGRSRTLDLIDSSLDELNFTAPISLVSVAEKIIEKVYAVSAAPSAPVKPPKVISQIPEFMGISVLNFFQKGEFIAVEAGQNAFQLIEQYCRKRQVLITTNFDGDVVLTRNSGKYNGLKLINIVNSPKNNIKQGFMSSGISGRYNSYKVKSQTNMAALNSTGGSTDAKQASDKTGEAIDGTIRSSRKIVIVSENAEDDANAFQRALWEANIRRTESFVYEATVFGHTNDNGLPWNVNELIRVTDQFSDVDALLLIERVDMSYDNTNGSETRLSMVVQDAFKVELSEPTNQKKTSSTGDLYKKLLPNEE